MRIETHRLILRSLKMSDFEALMTIWGDATVMKFCGGTTSRESEEKSLLFYLNYEKENGFAPYAVLNQSTNELIGVCGFNPKGMNYDGELMYHFHTSVWGKGYASEAIEACLEYAWSELHFKRIYATVEKGNDASVKLLKKFGFQLCQSSDTEAAYLLEKI